MDPFIGEIRAFGFPFAPNGWALCNGQLLPIQQYGALYAILGGCYGGNGTTTFALPNLQGSVPIGQGQGPGMSARSLGEVGGTVSETITTAELAPHAHPLNARAAPGQGPDPADATLATGTWIQGNKYGAVQQYSTSTPNVQMSPTAMIPVGGGQSHNNIMPYLVFSYCIALVGIFPPRS